jgi:hypothetical protein
MDIILLLKWNVDISLFILIWLVQVIIYPSFRYTAIDQFDYWHTRYMGLITYFVAPLMLLQIGLTGYQGYYNFDWLFVVSVLCIGLVWLSTAVLSIPCHTSLQKSGFDLPMIEKLIATNWYRTILWTIVILLDFWILF